MNNKFDLQSVKNIVSVNKLEFILNEKRLNLLDLINHKGQYYHPFKKIKNGKPRIIDNPSKKLKLIQKKIQLRILAKVPLPPYIIGSVKEKCIKDNAQLHIGQKVVVSVDLKNCFPKTKHSTVFSFFKQKMGYSNYISFVLTELTTYKGYVPQGAPTSSTLINLLLEDLYSEIKDYLDKFNITVSMWVDDIIFSGDNPEKYITEVVNIIHNYGYRVSKKKIKIMRQHKQQTVTGIVVNKKLGIPKIKKKEYARSILNEHNLRTQGQLAFVKSINSNQFKQLNKLLGHTNHKE